MAWYEYEGLTPGGTALAGRLEAGTAEEARDDLERMQVQLNEIRPAAAPPRELARLTEDDFLFFNEQLASLAEAGIALDDGLAQLARDVESRRLREWIQAIVADLRTGVPIDEAIARREAGLPLLYSRVIRAGIQSGELPATLLNLNQHLRVAANSRRILWDVMTYPLIVLTMVLAVSGLLFGLVAPRFKEIFKDFGTQLPALTVFLFVLSDHYVPLLIATVAVVLAIAVGWWALRLSPGGQAVRESIILRVPLVGRVYRASLISRFLRGISTAVATGIPLPAAMRLASGATGSPLLSAEADRLAGDVERGEPIFAATQSAELIPPLFGFSVQVAVGREVLPIALAQLARSYENRALHIQRMFRAILYPLLIVIAGLFVGMYVVGMFLPLVSLINCVSSGG